MSGRNNRHCKDCRSAELGPILYDHVWLDDRQEGRTPMPVVHGQTTWPGVTVSDMTKTAWNTRWPTG